MREMKRDSGKLKRRPSRHSPPLHLLHAAVGGRADHTGHIQFFFKLPRANTSRRSRSKGGLTDDGQIRNCFSFFTFADEGVSLYLCGSWSTRLIGVPLVSPLLVPSCLTSLSRSHVSPSSPCTARPLSSPSFDFLLNTVTVALWHNQNGSSRLVYSTDCSLALSLLRQQRDETN